MPLNTETSRIGAGDPIRLSDLLSAIGRSIILAQVSMDTLSVERAKGYIDNEMLATQALPFLALAETTIRLKVAVHDRDGGDLIVKVSADTLAKLPAHAVTELEVKLNPEDVRAYRDADGKTVLHQGS